MRARGRPVRIRRLVVAATAPVWVLRYLDCPRLSVPGLFRPAPNPLDPAPGRADVTATQSGGPAAL